MPIVERFNVENEDYYIDLLFYNLKVRSYVVIELKTTEFKPEYEFTFVENTFDEEPEDSEEAE